VSVKRCQVCLRTFGSVRFSTSRIVVCGRCVNALNERREVAADAQARIADMLGRGIVRNAERSLHAEESWKQDRARREIEDLDAAVARALPNWLNRLLRDPANTSYDFTAMRAYRRGLLHYDRPRSWGYPGNWKMVAARIRGLDGYRCVQCGDGDCVLDVHHIVYASNFGTHRQENLATLCRPCHEREHERSFDLAERDDSQPLLAIQPAPIEPLATAPLVTAPLVTTPSRPRMEHLRGQPSEAPSQSMAIVTQQSERQPVTTDEGPAPAQALPLREPEPTLSKSRKRKWAAIWFGGSFAALAVLGAPEAAGWICVVLAAMAYRLTT